MAAMAGLINRSLTAGQALTGKGADPMAAQPSATGGTDSTSGSSSSSATISSNDFLSLLVTEMQNQDPTADTDPNEYINQLVQVNSLEQLISINQNLSIVLGVASGTSSSISSSSQTTPDPAAAGPNTAAGHTMASAHKAGLPASAPPGGANTAAAIQQFAQSASQNHAPGNLSVPAAKPASRAVAHALDGHSHGMAIPGKLPVSQ